MDFDLLDGDSAIGTLEVPDGAAPEEIQAMSQKAIIAYHAHQAATAEGIDPELYTNLVRQESGFRPDVTSKAGAIGPAQLMPLTAQDLGVDPRDPAANLRGGAKYLRQMLDRYDGDTTRALAAYNAGPGTVDRYQGVPPFAETQAYVRSIQPAAAPVPAPAPPQKTGSGPFGIPTKDETIAATSAGMEKIPAWLGAGMLPVGAGALGTGAISGGYSGLLATEDAIHQHAAASGRSGVGALLDGIMALDRNDAAAIGKSMAIGAGVGAASHGLARLISGPVNAEREAATEALAVKGMPPPLTTSGAGEPLKAHLRETTTDLPKPDPAIAKGAYTALAATREAPLDAEPLRAVLARYGDEARAAGFQVPTPLNPATLPENPTMDQVLQRMSAINTLKRQKNLGVEPGIPGAYLRRLSKDLFTAVASQLTPVEHELLGTATEARLVEGQLQRFQDLLSAGARDGVPQGAKIANTLQNKAALWRAKLGDDLYTQALDWSRNVQTIQKAPQGRAVFNAVVTAAGGAATGAATSALFGMDPMRGAAYGAMGFGGLRQLGLLRAASNPALVHLTERLARARPGTEEFFAVAGRSLLAARAGAEVPEDAGQQSIDQQQGGEHQEQLIQHGLPLRSTLPLAKAIP